MPAVISRAWCGTINNFDSDLEEWLQNLFDSNQIVYGIGQMEIGASGTPHAQVYLVTCSNKKNKNGYSLSWIKDNIDRSAHWEKRFGTHEQARAYCMKDATRVPDTDYFEVGNSDYKEVAEASGGEASGKKHGATLLAIRDAIDNGADDAALYATHFSEMLRYKKSFDMYRLALRQKFRTVQTRALWLWGPAHTGKSHRARALAMKLDSEPYYLDLSGSTPWFDGMAIGCKVVVIEDFRGNCPISFMLKLLDHTPMQVQTKGSMMPFCAEWVIFTSNSHPRDVYGQQSENKIPLEVLNAWHSRFEGSRGSIIEMKDVFKSAEAVADVATMVQEIEAWDGQAGDLHAPTDSDDETPLMSDCATCPRVKGDTCRCAELHEECASGWCYAPLCDITVPCGRLDGDDDDNAEIAEYLDDIDREPPREEDLEHPHKKVRLSYAKPAATRKTYCECFPGDLPCDISRHVRETGVRTSTNSTDWSE